MSEIAKGVVLQRDKQTYALVPRLPMGILTKEILRNMAEVAEKYDIPLIKVTSAQRIALVGVRPEDISDIQKALDMEIGIADGPSVHYVQACPGIDQCKYAHGDALGLARRIEDAYVSRPDFVPAKTKIGISGCKMNCAESYVKDLGAFYVPKKGWTVVAGGNSGGNPRIADIIDTDLDEDEAFELIGRCLEFASQKALKRERFPRLIERFGLDAFKEAVVIKKTG